MKLLNVGAEHIDTYLSVATDNETINNWSFSLAHSDSNAPNFMSLRLIGVISHKLQLLAKNLAISNYILPPAKPILILAQSLGEVGSL